MRVFILIAAITILASASPVARCEGPPSPSPAEIWSKERTDAQRRGLLLPPGQRAAEHWVEGFSSKIAEPRQRLEQQANCRNVER